ncbi:MAG: InlB B-repeat-containing protein [Eubacteriales bacterium]
MDNNDGQKKLWGRGVYGSKDAPIRVLDIFIVSAIVLIIIFAMTFAINGGFSITFDSNGGSDVSYQKVKYGEYITEPSEVSKPGYVLSKWVTSEDETLAEEWSFQEDTVVEDMILYAIWVPSGIAVKYDLDGGNVNGVTDIEDSTVIYGEQYEVLPIPEKDGYVFDGWIYSGNIITEESIVEATGEHVLTALWTQE